MENQLVAEQNTSIFIQQSKLITPELHDWVSKKAYRLGSEQHNEEANPDQRTDIQTTQGQTFQVKLKSAHTTAVGHEGRKNWLS